jgi:predicted CopG family antitoxin
MSKTIKVSERVHQELQKHKEDSKTFNDVLRDLLDITPSIEKLTAYFTDEQRKNAKRIVNSIEETGDYEKEVTTERNHEALVFRSAANDEPIARIEFTESRARMYYRDQHGEMDNIGYLYGGKENQHIDYNGNDDVDEYIEDLKKKVKGANRKWGK